MPVLVVFKITLLSNVEFALLDEIEVLVVFKITLHSNPYSNFKIDIVFNRIQNNVVEKNIFANYVNCTTKIEFTLYKLYNLRLEKSICK